MRVGLIGINHRLAELQLREKLAKACQKRFWGHFFHSNHSFVLLSTCNRTEVYFSSEDLAATHTYLLSILRNDVEEDFDHKLYSYFGVDCFSHLSRVAAGLDSAIVAETEIQGQVKLAYEYALGLNPLPKELHFLFQKALGLAKKVRSEFRLGRGLPTLDQAVLNTGKHFFESLENQKILFVGASEINQKILNLFVNKQIPQLSMCNRTVETAQFLAEKKNIQLLDWANLSEWHRYDWIILGTKAPRFLIEQENTPSHMMGRKLIMDLSVPRNVDPKLGLDPQVTLLNIDQLNRLVKIKNQSANRSLIKAEEMINETSRRQIAKYVDTEQNKILPLIGIA